MKTALRTAMLLTLVFSQLSCDGIVNDVGDPVSSTGARPVQNAEQLDSLVTGVKQRFATTLSQTALLSDALSDMLFYTPGPTGAERDDFKQIDDGRIRFDNPAATRLFRDLGELRYLADDLLARAERFAPSQPALRQRVEFAGNLYGGIARYLFATYTGLTEKQGGGVIDAGPFIPADQMYQQAVDRFRAALALAGDDSERRSVNSMLARTYLFMGDPASAASSAQAGLQNGDAPFEARFSAESANGYWAHAGRGGASFAVAPRVQQVLAADPLEAGRLPLEPLPGDSSVWLQAKYPAASSSIPFVSWQENELMMAELLLSGDEQAALEHVNTVRTFYGLTDLNALSLPVLASERERTLFGQGMRLVDQRRFRLFHLPAGTWQYFPIPEEERVRNPNL